MNGMFSLKGRNAWVTGAAYGIGFAIAKAFVEAGIDNIIFNTSNEASMQKGLEAYREAGIKNVHGYVCDVTDETSIDAALAAADEKFGHVEVLVNCAGGERGTGTKLVDFDRGDWDFTMNLDLSSVFTMTKKLAGYMVKGIEAGSQTYGRIINIASIYGLVGNTAIPTIAYHASKGAVVNFSRGAAAELAPLGITVNTICPGYFYTELTTETLDTEYFQAFAKQSVPMQRYGKQGELNAAAVFLGSEEASYVTGQAIAVDGGYTAV